MTTLTPEELGYFRNNPIGQSQRRLIEHIDALTDENSRLLAANRDVLTHFNAMKTELSQAQAELAALRAGAQEREDAAAKAAKALFGVTLTKVTAAPQPPAQAVAVRVKPLVWEETHIGRGDGTTEHDGGYEAESPIGVYTISVCMGRGDYCWWHSSEGRPTNFSDDAVTAKSAAQADYARRILSAIDARPEAAVKAEALREVAEKINAAAEDVYSNTENCDATVGYQNAADICRTEADRLERGGAS